MKRILLLLCGIMLVPVIACSQHLVEVGKGYSCTSVNTTVFRNNSLVTHGDEQYISYYDNDGYLVLGKRKLDSEQWTLHRTQYQGNVKDAHNIISMMIDGEGYMHVSFDHHGHPLNYCRSIAPGSLELGDKMPMTGVDEGNVTFIRRRFIVCLPLRFFGSWKSGNEPLFAERTQMDSCAGYTDRRRK